MVICMLIDFSLYLEHSDYCPRPRYPMRLISQFTFQYYGSNISSVFKMFIVLFRSILHVHHFMVSMGFGWRFTCQFNFQTFGILIRIRSKHSLVRSQPRGSKQLNVVAFLNCSLSLIFSCSLGSHFLSSVQKPPTVLAVPLS